MDYLTNVVKLTTAQMQELLDKQQILIHGQWHKFDKNTLYLVEDNGEIDEGSWSDSSKGTNTVALTYDTEAKQLVATISNLNSHYTYLKDNGHLGIAISRRHNAHMVKTLTEKGKHKRLSDPNSAHYCINRQTIHQVLGNKATWTHDELRMAYPADFKQVASYQNYKKYLQDGTIPQTYQLHYFDMCVVLLYKTTWEGIDQSSQERILPTDNVRYRCYFDYTGKFVNLESY